MIKPFHVIYLIFLCTILNCADSGPIDVPQNLSATQGKYSDHIHIKWDSVSGATVYALFRRDEFSEEKDEVYFGDRVFYDDYNISVDEIFNYSVRAGGGDEKSKYSAEVEGYAEQ